MPSPFSSHALPVGQRLALRIEYDGSAFAGWQAQPHLDNAQTVQSSVERALAAIAACPVRIHCAGRTDSGVHASAQWVHFDTPVPRGLKAWVVGGNAKLPDTVRIADARAVGGDFHARHSAMARRYDYLIANTPVAPALLHNRVLWVRDELNVAPMHAAVQALLGERDFSAFRAAACQSRSPMRFMEQARVTREGAYVRITLVANAFLHHMVRNIVGSTLKIGLGQQAPHWLAELLEAKDRTLAAATAPPQGLYLSGVRYPPRHGIPDAPLPIFFAGN